MNGPPPPPPSGFDHNERAIQQQQELSSQREREREREYNERQERERQQREHYGGAPPHQNNTGSITIHQPVASRLPGAISPGGLLANQGGPPSVPLGAPNGPGNAFGPPLHSEASRAAQHNPSTAPTQLQQNHGFGAPSILNHTSAPPVAHSVSNMGNLFGGAASSLQQQQQEARLLPFNNLPSPATPSHQMPGAPALGQGGQQPILNVSRYILCAAWKVQPSSGSLHTTTLLYNTTRNIAYIGLSSFITRPSC